MSEKDSADNGGTQGRQPEGSQSQSGQQNSSSPEYVTVEQFREIQKSLDLVARQLQGEKDRAVKKTNERLDGVEKDLKAVLQIAKRDGKDIDTLLSEVESQEEADFRQVMLEVAKTFKNGGLPQSATGGTAQSKGVDVSAVLKDLEMDLSDLRVKEFATRKFESEAQAYAEGAKLLKTIISRQPTDADQPSGASERTKAASQQEKLMQEYADGSKNLRGQALINFKMQMRKKGLDIT